MLPGVTGALIGGAFLEDLVLSGRDAALMPDRAASVALQKWWRRADKLLGPTSAARAVLDVAALPLIHLLGYTPLHLEPHGQAFVGTFSDGSRATAVLVSTTWGVEAEAAWRDIVRAGRTSGARWGIVCTGRSVRLIDASRAWSRRALEFDLAALLADEKSTAAFLALCRCEALSSASGHSRLSRWIQQSDEHGLAVCASLGDGVLEALGALVGALDRPPGRTRPTEKAAFEQAVTLVYRLMFLLFAEARGLVPTWHHVYRDAYSIDALRRRSASRSQPRGLWTALQAISRLAHAGCRAGDLIVTPFNGRLFSPHHTPLGEQARIPDAVVGRAVLAIATAPSDEGCRAVSYADLGVEQLGTVYERVLEYEPTRQQAHRRNPAHGTRHPAPLRSELLLTRTSTERKTTGSFYTPRAMTEFLVRRTLHPLVAGRSSDEILRMRVVDPAMGSGAFLVASCRYLAGAVERALLAEGRWTADKDAGPRRADLRRLVAQRCLYGVDLNPMAVQLARLSLWLTTLAGQRPLTFLDHHLTAGDSLLGAGFSDLARDPPGKRRRASPGQLAALPLFDDETAEQMARGVLPDRFRIAHEPDDTPEMVRAKERALAALVAPGTALARWKTAADLWCAAGFWNGAPLSPGVYHDVLAALLDSCAALPAQQRTAVLDRAASIAGEHHFFHWDLEFPEVFFDEQGRRDPGGGFDAVVGNPPWDVLRADTGDVGTRERLRRGRESRLRFTRDAGLYRLQGAGHANRYQLFLERALQVTRPGGRIGLILPSGLATDHGSARLRRALLDTVDVDRLHGFDNRKGIFPIHRDVKFLLVTGTVGGRTDRLTCSFGHSETEWLDQLPDASTEDPPAARPIVLSRALLERWDPEHLTFPLLHSPIDLGLLTEISAAIPRLDDRLGWDARFGRELNATDDGQHFVARDPKRDALRTRAAGRLLTVVEGKHLEPFRLLQDASATAIPVAAARTLLDAARTFERRRIAYRDVASATNRLTLIAAMLPAGTVSTHTLFCLKTPLDDANQYCLLALLNSLVANYLVRLQVTTHVTTALMARLRVPRPASGSVTSHELATLARSLENTGVAGDVPSFVRINTIAAQLYGLRHDQYAHIVSTFPLLPQTLRDECIRDHQQATCER